MLYLYTRLFLGTGLSDIWKSHSTVQSGITGQCAINFKNINLISVFLGGKEREWKGKQRFFFNDSMYFLT